MALNKVTGRVRIKVSGKLLLSKHGAELDFGGVKRTPIIGSNGIHGYSEETVAPTVTCSVSHRADTSLEELANYVDETLVFETDSGHSYVLAGAFLSESPKLMEREGEVRLAFAGISCDEI
ncbi:MAG: phage tail tube protein [Sinobacteraceae bacterium]|nr:phage tail tube protein [Nevskiaceae bacterium]